MADTPSLWCLSHTETADFVSKHLRPDNDIAHAIDDALDTVITHLKSRVTYNISRIQRGGLLAQRVHLKDEEFDFELYLFIGDLRGIDEHRQRIEKILTETREVLDTEDLLHLVMVRGDEEQMFKEGGISIRVMADDEWFEGKVFPTVDLLGVKPSKATLDTMYRQFLSDDEKACFSPALSILYVELIQPLPDNVKDLILLLKHWERSRLQLRGRKPPPRFWEVLVVRRWEIAGSPQKFNCARGLFDVLEVLADWRTIMITWETGEQRCYAKKIAEEKKREIENRRGEQVPVIYDPVDPRLNHAHGIRPLVWDEMARTAMESCNDQLFEAVKRLRKWTE